jgi:hypothetical protein
MMVNLLNNYNPTLTPIDIIEAFPDEASVIVPRLMRECKREMKHSESIFKQVMNLPLNHLERTFVIGVLDIFKPNKIFKKYERLDRLETIMRIKGIGGRRDKSAGMAILPIEEAKQVPFKSIHAFEKIKDTKTGFTAICPLHGEKTPSFNVRNNKFKCFGCGKSGSTIDFIMSLYEIPFAQAVRRLGNYNKISMNNIINEQII